jgi:hypothetical protein
MLHPSLNSEVVRNRINSILNKLLTAVGPAKVTSTVERAQSSRTVEEKVIQCFVWWEMGSQHRACQISDGRPGELTVSVNHRGPDFYAVAKVLNDFLGVSGFLRLARGVRSRAGGPEWKSPTALSN